MIRLRNTRTEARSLLCPMSCGLWFPVWSWEGWALLPLLLFASFPGSQYFPQSTDCSVPRRTPRQTLSRSPGFSLVSSFPVPCPMNFICLWLPGPAAPSPHLRESAEFPDLLIPAPQTRTSLPAVIGVTKGLVSFVSCHSEITLPHPHVQCQKILHFLGYLMWEGKDGSVVA